MKNIKNIGIIAETKEDRVILIEKMGFYMENEETNNSPWDFIQCQREMNIVIEFFVTTESWKNIEINIINISSIKNLNTFSIILQALKGSVVYISATKGLSSAMVELWQKGIKNNLSSVIFIGEIAKSGVDFFGLVQDMQERLPIEPLIIQLPIYQDGSFEGFIDLINMRELIWDKISKDSLEYRANKPKIQKILPKLEQQALKYHQKMLEQIAEVDGNENFMEKFLDDKELTTKEIVQAIKVATISKDIVPVVIGCLSLNMGIRELLDTIINYLPSPFDTPFQKAIELESGREIIIEPKENKPFVGLVLDIMSDPFLGKLTVVYIYRGKLVPKQNILNITKNKKETIGHIVKREPTIREKVKELFIGEIRYISNLKEAQIGDTLCDPMHKVILKLEQNLNMNFVEKR